MYNLKSKLNDMERFLLTVEKDVKKQINECYGYETETLN